MNTIVWDRVVDGTLLLHDHTTPSFILNQTKQHNLRSECHQDLHSFQFLESDWSTDNLPESCIINVYWDIHSTIGKNSELATFVVLKVWENSHSFSSIATWLNTSTWLIWKLTVKTQFCQKETWIRSPSKRFHRQQVSVCCSSIHLGIFFRLSSNVRTKA